MGSAHILQGKKSAISRFEDLRVYVVEPALSFRSSIKLFLHNLFIKHIEVMGTAEELERAILTHNDTLARYCLRNGIPFAQDRLQEPLEAFVLRTLPVRGFLE